MTVEEATKLVSLKYEDRKERFKHILGVKETAKKLANIYKIDSYKVEIAALFHDYTKYDSADFQKKYMSDDELKEFLNIEVMYHAISASNYVREEFKINDLEILSAIKKHVFGGFNMSIIDKIVLISDKIEPSRNYPEVKVLRALAYKDLDLAIYNFLVSNISYNLKKGFKIPLIQERIVKDFKEKMDEKNR